MKTKNLFYLFLFLTAGTFILSSCQKNKSGLMSDTDLAVAEDDALTESIFDDVMNSVDNAVNLVDNTLLSGTFKSLVVSDSCPKITVDKPDTIRWPKIITIDYGEGCTGFYGQTRSGMIKITVTGWHRHPGSTRTVELMNYFINGIHVEGTKTVTNNGRNDNDNLTFTIELTGGKITTPDSVVMTREFSRTREWVAGESTRNHWDDEFFITGAASGTNFRGEAYSRTITNPLEWAASCRFVKSGTIQIEVGDRSPITLDYGSGECDAEATVTKDGETKTIILKYRHRKIIH